MLATLRGIVLQRSTVVSFIAFFSVLALWSGAVPMYGSPDETAHMVRAAGIVRGQVDGVRGADNLVWYDVPVILASEPPCYAFKPEQTADCLVLPADTTDAPVASTASTYPPMLHVISGWPTLTSSGVRSLYLMRLTVSLVNAALLTLALANCSLLRRQRPIAAVLPLALTPMVLFLSGTVNPSGLTTAAALAVWTAAFVLGEQDAPRSIGRSAAAFGLPLCLLILTRRDSLLWVSAIVVVLLVVIPFSRIRSIIHDRSAQIWIGVVGATAGVQFLLWTRGNAEGFTTAGAAGSNGDGGTAFGLSFHYFRQVIGVLGWLDTVLPPIVHTSWWAAFVGVGFFALTVSRWRSIAALALTVLFVLAITTYVGSIQHPYFQGRYYLPLAVGFPLIAARGIADAGIGHVRLRLLAVGYGALFLLHQLAFAQHLRRYAVGAEGSWSFIWDHRWEPIPGPIWLFIVAYAVATAALLFVIATIALRDEDDFREPPLTPREAEPVTLRAPTA